MSESIIVAIISVVGTIAVPLIQALLSSQTSQSISRRQIIFGAVVGLTLGIVIGLGTTRLINSQNFTMSELEYDMDRPGQRPGDDYRIVFPIDTAERCQKNCVHEQQCLTWTYVKKDYNNNHEGNPACYLKNSFPPKKEDPCCISGYKQFNK